ncbi:MAG: TetR/AcrR family transcriptional regulator, partial [Candidatus Cryptobacteroides sp.]
NIDIDIEKLIIDSAREVFLEKGFNETSMGDIAERAGINRTALHYYFRTKDRMFEAVFSGIISAFIPSVVQILELDIPVRDRISRVVDIYMGIILENPRIPIFIVREIQRDPQHLLDTIKHLDFAPVARTIKEVVKRETEAGNIRQVPLYSIVYTYYGLLFAPFISRPLTDAVNPETDEDFRRRLVAWKDEVVRLVCSIFAL